jgi:hypothetical protein
MWERSTTDTPGPSGPGLIQINDPEVLRFKKWFDAALRRTLGERAENARWTVRFNPYRQRIEVLVRTVDDDVMLGSASYAELTEHSHYPCMWHVYRAAARMIRLCQRRKR